MGRAWTWLNSTQKRDVKSVETEFEFDGILGSMCFNKHFCPMKQSYSFILDFLGDYFHSFFLKNL